MRALLAAPAALGLVVAAVLAAPSCARSGLSKAYEAYNAKVEPLLDREAPVWKKVGTLLNEQGRGEELDLKRFADVLNSETLPFYDQLRASVEKLEPGDPGLAGAQSALVKFAKARSDLARALCDNVEAIRVGDPASKMNVKDAALTSAMSAYGEAIKGDVASADNRYGELVALETDFQTTCIEPLAEGKATADDVKSRIASRILPKLKTLRATKFADDEPSRLLRVAIVAAGEFFDAVVEDLPRMEASARFKRTTEVLVRDGADAHKQFLDAMDAVRRRM